MNGKSAYRIGLIVKYTILWASLVDWSTGGDRMEVETAIPPPPPTQSSNHPVTESDSKAKTNQKRVVLSRKHVTRWYRVRQRAKHRSNISFVNWLLDLAESDLRYCSFLFTIIISDNL